MAGRPHGSTGTAPAAGGDVVASARGGSQQDPSGDVGQLYRALVEHAREAVTIVDASGVVVYHNPSMGRVVGRPPEWFEGRSPLELMPPEDAARAVRVLQQLAGNPGAQLPGEFRLRHSDGSGRRLPPVCSCDSPACEPSSNTQRSLVLVLVLLLLLLLVPMPDVHAMPRGACGWIRLIVPHEDFTAVW